MLKLKLRRYESIIWPAGMRELAQEARQLSPSFVVVHDLPLLPLALAIRQSVGSHCRVFFDAREYYTRHFEDVWWWRFFYGKFNHYLIRKYLPAADVMVTVNNGLAAEYRREFNVACGVLPSYPEPASLTPSPIEPGQIRMIHHGLASRSRRIEDMIGMMRLLPDHFTLDLMLTGGDPSYLTSLRSQARGLSNVRFLTPVSFDEIIPCTNLYDIGMYLLPPLSFNSRHALPNKFFEFIQARLAVAIGPSVEMTPFIKRFDCGIVADDFTPSALARALSSLTPTDLIRLKENSHRAAAALNTHTLRDQVLACALNGKGSEVFV